ncbi:hypothetical protein U3653_28875 [Nocardia sp. CDC186]|uniref:DUF4232 domain-containing protein n=1 Tax=Nocardia implantans TaxID=3108168 RepID=A0ABU6B2Y5_9NOCA|nr:MULTISPECIES: hypothetical protein [unclassified Nocardia]MBF6190364.1 hypothetical protein [Nocardia beijingensis]MEA3531892.1 hypothetical protein [Nocardia sp. CDC192]MEB3514056.1 hypothetical protein [Nocardia sp. CDC186]
MLEPNGPLPPEIYWRRRVFAIGILVVALALVIWVVLAVVRGGDSPGDAAAGGTSSAVTKSADAAAKPSAESGAPKSSAAATTVAAGPCPDQSLAIKVTVEQPTYKTGEQPVFGIVITNISAVACTRDMGSGLQQVSVHTLDGQRRLWSSTDCYPDGQPDVRTMGRGEQAAFTVTWSGTTSQPNCAGERVQVPPGPYSVVAQLGSVRSMAEPFNIA